MAINIDNLALNLAYQGSEKKSNMAEFESLLSSLLQQAIQSYRIENNKRINDTDNFSINLSDIHFDDFMDDPDAYFERYLLPRIYQVLADQQQLIDSNAEEKSLEKITLKNDIQYGEKYSPIIFFEELHTGMPNNKTIDFDDFVAGIQHCLRQQDGKSILLTALGQIPIFQSFTRQIWANIDNPMAKKILQKLFSSDVAHQLFLVAQQADTYAEIMWSLAQQCLHQHKYDIDRKHWHLSVKILSALRQSKVALNNTQWQSLTHALSSLQDDSNNRSKLWLKEINTWLMVSHCQNITRVEVDALLTLTNLINVSHLPTIISDTHNRASVNNSRAPVNDNRISLAHSDTYTLLSEHSHSLRGMPITESLKKSRQTIQVCLSIAQQLRQLCVSKNRVTCADFFSCVNALLLQYPNMSKKWRSQLAMLSTISFTVPTALNLAAEQIEFIQHTSDKVCPENITPLTRLTSLPITILWDIQQLLLVRDEGDSHILLVQIEEKIKRKLLQKNETFIAAMGSDFWLPLQQAFTHLLAYHSDISRRIEFELIVTGMLAYFPISTRYTVLKWMQMPTSDGRFHAMVNALKRFGLHSSTINSSIVSNAASNLALVKTTQKGYSKNRQWMIVELEDMLQKIVMAIPTFKKSVMSSTIDNKHIEKNKLLIIATDTLGIFQQLIALELTAYKLKTSYLDRQSQAKLHNILLTINNTIASVYTVLPIGTQRQIRLQTWWLRLDNHFTSATAHSSSYSIRTTKSLAYKIKKATANVKNFPQSAGDVNTREQCLQMCLLVREYLRKPQENLWNNQCLSELINLVQSLIPYFKYHDIPENRPLFDVLTELFTLLQSLHRSLHKSLQGASRSKNIDGHVLNVAIVCEQALCTIIDNERIYNESIDNHKPDNFIPDTSFFQKQESNMASESMPVNINPELDNACILPASQKINLDLSQGQNHLHVAPTSGAEQVNVAITETSQQENTEASESAHPAINAENRGLGTTPYYAHCGLQTLDSLSKILTQSIDAPLSEDAPLSNATSELNFKLAAQAAVQAKKEGALQLSHNDFDELIQPLEQQLDRLNSLSNMTLNTADQAMGWDAGLVLFYPFLRSLFQKLSIIDTADQWLGSEAQDKAMAVLMYLYWGELHGGEVQESPPSCCNLLIGRAIDADYLSLLVLTVEEQTECDHLVQSVIRNWKALKTMSADSFRELFIQRQCTIEDASHGYNIIVEPQPQDILLCKLPWGLGMIQLPWLQDVLLDVQWHSGM